PVWTTGILDTGTNVTCFATDLVRRLGLARMGQTTTQTASGSLSVDLFDISLSIPPLGRVAGPMLTYRDLVVMDLIDPIPAAAALIGLDILLTCRLLLDGPGRQFILDF